MVLHKYLFDLNASRSLRILCGSCNHLMPRVKFTYPPKLSPINRCMNSSVPLFNRSHHVLNFGFTQQRNLATLIRSLKNEPFKQQQCSKRNTRGFRRMQYDKEEDQLIAEKVNKIRRSLKRNLNKLRKALKKGDSVTDTEPVKEPATQQDGKVEMVSMVEPLITQHCNRKINQVNFNSFDHRYSKRLNRLKHSASRQGIKITIFDERTPTRSLASNPDKSGKSGKYIGFMNKKEVSRKAEFPGKDSGPKTSKTSSAEKLQETKAPVSDEIQEASESLKQIYYKMMRYKTTWADYLFTPKPNDVESFQENLRKELLKVPDKSESKKIRDAGYGKQPKSRHPWDSLYDQNYHTPIEESEKPLEESRQKVVETPVPLKTKGFKNPPAFKRGSEERQIKKTIKQLYAENQADMFVRQDPLKAKKISKEKTNFQKIKTKARIAADKSDLQKIKTNARQQIAASILENDRESLEKAKQNLQMENKVEDDPIAKLVFKNLTDPSEKPLDKNAVSKNLKADSKFYEFSKSEPHYPINMAEIYNRIAESKKSALANEKEQAKISESLPVTNALLKAVSKSIVGAFQSLGPSQKSEKIDYSKSWPSIHFFQMYDKLRKTKPHYILFSFFSILFGSLGYNSYLKETKKTK